MVKQVLGFARGVGGERVPVQPERLLTDTERMLRETFPRHVTLEFRVAAPLPTLIGDATQLQQIFLNLCVNARDAMPAGGRLTVEAEECQLGPDQARGGAAGRYLRVAVVDTGTGIAPENMGKLFDPFFTTKEIGKGTGLGLSTALAIARSHGGFIEVESDPGRGSRFEVYLPVQAQPGPAAAATEEDARPEGAGEWVLLVDDEDAIREVARETLEAHGYRVLTAADGAAALACFDAHRDEIAVVVTDLMMPTLDGAATARALKQRAPELPIIGLSGFGDPVVASDGFSVFLPKPVTTARLLQALHDSLHPPAAPRG
jgi:CheY-like chemotaxis protein